MMDKANIKDFRPELQVLCARMLSDNRTAEAAGEMIEVQLAVLAGMIALATDGDTETIEKMCRSASDYLFEHCVKIAKAGLGHVMLEVKDDLVRE